MYGHFTARQNFVSVLEVCNYLKRLKLTSQSAEAQHTKFTSLSRSPSNFHESEISKSGHDFDWSPD